MKAVHKLLVRSLFARPLLKNGFADRGVFRSEMELIQSLTDHADAEEVEFFC